MHWALQIRFTNAQEQLLALSTGRLESQALRTQPRPQGHTHQATPTWTHPNTSQATPLVTLPAPSPSPPSPQGTGEPVQKLALVRWTDEVPEDGGPLSVKSSGTQLPSSPLLRHP